MKKLGGWQRLWVVGSVVWLGVVVFLATIPQMNRQNRQLRGDKAELGMEWALSTIETALKSIEMPSGFQWDPPISEQVESEYQKNLREGLSVPGIVAMFHLNYREADYSGVDADYKEAYDHLETEYQQDRDRLISEALIGIPLVWLASSVGVYLIAWGGWRVVVWVWRGFKLKGDSE